MHIDRIENQRYDKLRYEYQQGMKLAKFCAVIGIVIIILGIRSYNKYSNYVVTSATIVQQTRRYYDDEDRRYTYYYKAEYTVADKTYNITVSTYSQDSVGKTVAIRYNPNNPADSGVGDNSKNGGLALFGFAETIACMGYGIYCQHKLENL